MHITPGGTRVNTDKGPRVDLPIYLVPDIPVLPNAKAQAILKAPQSNRTLSNREQMVVLRSSKVAGHKFPPWIKEPSQSEFDFGELFMSVP